MAFTPQQKPAPTMGSLQQSFVFRFRQFLINDQFTIIEDLPVTKPVRQVTRQSAKGFNYSVFLMKISSGGVEADLEMMDHELTAIAIACPKDTKNFKGITLAFDGRRWVYICSDTNAQQNAPTTQFQPQGSNTDIEKLVTGIKAINSIGTDVLMSDLIKMADKITPGKALDLIQAAKAGGYVYEKDGCVKVS